MDRRAFLNRGLAAVSLLPTCSSRLLAASQYLSNQEKIENLSLEPLRRLAFGSCNDQTKDQAYWQLIGRQLPQLWLWLGDNIYADRAELKERRQLYQLQKNSLHYREFWKKIPIIGTWDDHDYYTENAGASYAEKDASKALMLEFLDVGAEHPVRQHQGVYQNYELGPEGQKTQIIMLDLRYFQNRNKNEPELLGAQQWNFLESTIADSSSNLLIIGSSLNVCSSVRLPHLEGWNAFPNERKRLYELLASTDKPCIFLSGDRHMGEFYRIILDNGKAVYEVMSSGLTHALGVKFPNKYQLGEMVGRKHFGLLNIDWSSTGPQIQIALQSAERQETFSTLLAQF